MPHHEHPLAEASEAEAQEPQKVTLRISEGEKQFLDFWGWPQSLINLMIYHIVLMICHNLYHMIL